MLDPKRPQLTTHPTAQLEHLPRHVHHEWGLKMHCRPRSSKGEIEKYAATMCTNGYACLPMPQSQWRKPTETVASADPDPMGAGVGLEVGHRLNTQETERAGGGPEGGSGCGDRLNTQRSDAEVSASAGGEAPFEHS